MLIREGDKIRVLVAFEDNYRTYRQTIAACLQIRRPDVQVETAELANLEKKLEDFAPQVVICSGHRAMSSGDEIAWIALSLDLNMPARIKVGGCYKKIDNPTLEQILALIDDLE